MRIKVENLSELSERALYLLERGALLETTELVEDIRRIKGSPLKGSLVSNRLAQYEQVLKEVDDICHSIDMEKNRRRNLAT